MSNDLIICNKIVSSSFSASSWSHNPSIVGLVLNRPNRPTIGFAIIHPTSSIHSLYSTTGNFLSLTKYYNLLLACDPVGRTGANFATDFINQYSVQALSGHSNEFIGHSLKKEIALVFGAVMFATFCRYKNSK